MNAVPLELITHVLSFVLSARDMLSCSCVCQEWKQVSEDENIWKSIYMKKWKVGSADLTEQGSLEFIMNWKQEYIGNTRHAPSVLYQILDDHRDEVWTVKWSHNGRYVASASKDCVCQIYELKHTSKHRVPYLELYHAFTFEDAIAFVEWSFSDNFIAITSIACKAFVASISDKKLVTSVECFQFDTHAVWLPDDTLVVGSRLTFSRINEQTFMQHTLWRKFPLKKANCAYETNILNLIYISKIPGPNVVEPEQDPIWKDRESLVIAETGAILGTLVSACGQYLLVNVRPFVDPPGYLIPKYTIHTVDKINPPDDPVANVEEVAGDLSPVMSDRRGVLAEQCLAILGMFQGGYDSSATIQLGTNQEMHLWDLHKMKRVQSYQGHVANSHSDNPFMCWPSIGRTYMATGSEDGCVYVFHKAHSSPVHVLSGHHSLVNAVAFHPQNNLMVSLWSSIRALTTMQGVYEAYKRNTLLSRTPLSAFEDGSISSLPPYPSRYIPSLQLRSSHV